MFSQYFHSYSLGFPSLYIHKNFLKNLWKESIVFKWFLSNFNRFCCSDFLFLYIYKKFLKNLWKQNILFQTILLLGFSLLKDLQKIFEKFMKTKYCVSNYFVAWIIYIFTKLFEKFMDTKYCIPSYFVTQIFLSYIYLRKIFEKFMKTKYCI